MAIQHVHPSARFSEATVFQGVVYLAGQIPTTGNCIETQMADVLRQVDALLAETGSCKRRILMTTIYLTDIEADYDGMNRVWDAWLADGLAPPRATVQARLAKPEWKVEVVVTAAQFAETRS